MANYIVTRKSDGVEIYRYQSDAPIEWNGMEFVDYDHVPAPVVNTDGSIQAVYSHVLTKLEYLRRFTVQERVTIRAAAAQNPVLADYLQLMELAQDINTGDPDTIDAVTMLEQAGLIAEGRAREILNGK